MALRNIPITVDLNRSVRSNQEIWGRVGDNGLMTLNVSVIDTSDSTKKVVNLTGLKFYFTIVYPDGTYFRDSLGVVNRVDAEGTFDYTLAANCFAQAGEFECHFRIEQGTTTVLRSGTRDFTLTVAADPLQGNIEMDNFASDIDQLNADIQSAIAESQAQLNDALEDLAIASTNVDAAVVKANEVIAAINANQVVKTADTINWQKAKLTTDAGIAKAPPDVTTLAAITEQGSFYMNSTAVAKLTDAPVAGTGAFRLENHKLVTGTAVEQHARYFSPSNAAANRHFFRYVGATASPWREYENTTGSQAKADAAQATATAYTDTALSSFAPYVQLFRGAAYFLDTNSYTFPADAVKIGLYIDVSRYTPGTGALDYGFRTIFIPREAMLENSGKAIWESMVGTDGAKKIFYATPTSIKGHAENGASPANGWCIRRVGYR